MEWQEKTYKKAFKATCQTLKHQIKKNQKDIIELKQELKYLYIRLDNNWTGRGVIAELTQEATIAAYEYIIFQLQKNKINEVNC